MKSTILVLVCFSLVMVKAEPPLHHDGGGYGGSPVYASPGPAYGPPAPIYGPPAQGFGPGIGGPAPVHHGATPIIHKHVYVHVPPPEPYIPRIKKPYVPPPPPQKHYKIIFIKAPTPPPVELPDVPIIPPAPETKTLVYVLTKKPEPAPQLNIPVPPPPVQHKPEVYFIRYRTPNGGVSDGAVLDAGGGVGIGDIGAQQGFQPISDGGQIFDGHNKGGYQ